MLAAKIASLAQSVAADIKSIFTTLSGLKSAATRDVVGSVEDDIGIFESAESGGSSYTLFADGSAISENTVAIDFSGTVWDLGGAGNFSYFQLGGSLSLGMTYSPLRPLPKVHVQVTDSFIGDRAAYIGYYTVNRAGIESIFVVSPVPTTANGGGTITFRISAKGFWK